MKITAMRDRIGFVRWVIVAIATLFPAWFLLSPLMSTLLGDQFSNAVVYDCLRWSIFAISVIIVGICVTHRQDKLLSFHGLLASIVITGSIMSFLWVLVGVSDYPLPLYWSEGNRLWDYSLLFGRSLYQYPSDKPIFTAIDLGRQLLWGLPFLIPGVSIQIVRLWGALVSTIPYAILGWVLFRPLKNDNESLDQEYFWILSGLWVFLFLFQAAVYTPLILCAALVAWGWQHSWKISAPLVVVASLYAFLTRTSWMFAPALWIGMLEILKPTLPQDSWEAATFDKPWKRALSLFTVGVLSGVVFPAGYSFLKPSVLLYLSQIFGNTINGSTAVAIHALILLALELVCLLLVYALWRNFGRIAALHKLPWRMPLKIVIFGLLLIGLATVGGLLLIEVLRGQLVFASKQPLLWYRLFPNPTNAEGILFAMLRAAGVLILFLIALIFTKCWNLNSIQKWIISLPMLAFLGVGLIASVKIGGGSNLHNMDMFFVGLLILAAITWQMGADHFIYNPDQLPVWLKGLLLLVVFLPVIPIVLNIAPLSLMPEDEVQNAVNQTIVEVDRNKSKGEILFMDHRQLLTFGFIQDVPLVPEYEKKYMMDQAMVGNETYFDQFYADLAKRRFVLIVTDPLKIEDPQNKDTDIGFKEENDAWNKWVVEPTLQYYKPLVQFKGLALQLLVPR